MEHEADINKERNNGCTRLFIACQEGHIEVVKYLVEHGVDLNKEGNNYWILLFYSCQNGYEDIVKYLIDRNKEKIKYLYKTINIIMKKTLYMRWATKIYKNLND